MNDISWIGVAADAATVHAVVIAAAITSAAFRMLILREEFSEVLFLFATVCFVFAVFFALA